MKMKMKMNTITIISLVALFAGGDADVQQEIKACYNAHMLDAPFLITCYNFVNLDACLKKITPMNQADKEELEGALNYVDHERKSCPGLFSSLDTCSANEISTCMGSFKAKKLFLDESICNDTKQVRDCMENKLKGACTDEFITSHNEDVDLVDSQCKDGSLFDEPCGDRAINKCSEALFADHTEGENGRWIYRCDEKVVAQTKKCLSDLETKCKEDDWAAWIIDFAQSNIGLACPKNNSE